MPLAYKNLIDSIRFMFEQLTQRLAEIKQRTQSNASHYESGVLAVNVKLITAVLYTCNLYLAMAVLHLLRTSYFVLRTLPAIAL